MRRIVLLSLGLIIIGSTVFAQKNEDWFNKDFESGGQLGISAQKAYDLVKNKPSKEVIVAVIDSGVDIEHEDLKDNIWINKNEIDGNGVDDDKNGYIDDIHGWNFIGGPNGNIIEETYETTRLYRKLKPIFEGKSFQDIDPSEKKRYKLYVETKKITEDKLKSSEKTKNQLDGFEQYLITIQSILEPYLLGKEMNEENLLAISSGNTRVNAAREDMLERIKSGFTMEGFREYKKYIDSRVLYHYNIDHNPRKIVGDNEEDPFERHYGNNDVYGGRAEHGTHVAGIIGAVRNNGIGIDGVAENVKIMALRAVPDGDERDKDIANAIIYAVDNGARIINMSFGKGHSPNKVAVDKAIQYASENNVLLVHAAGNSADNIDQVTHYPHRHFGNIEESRESAPNWIEVGASNRKKDLSLPAEFSNYGIKTVDVFSPGVEIYSTIPENQYKENSGTSMAAPVVSGVAALVLSYFPHLTAIQLRDIIIKSSLDCSKVKVYIPQTKEGKKKKTKFKKLSMTGSIVNAHGALKMAGEISK